MGIVAGRNATTFDPEGKVTGIETAKMLLCLIGFDAKAQGYVGTNWKTHVLADAKNMGLLAGFAADYEADKAITREGSCSDDAQRSEGSHGHRHSVQGYREHHQQCVAR